MSTGMNEMDNDFSDEALYLVGVRLHPDQDGPQLYTVLLMNENARGGKDRPLTDADGYIVLFADAELAQTAMTYGDAAFRKHGDAPSEVSATYDIAAAVSAVTEGSHDGEAGDVVNILLDLVEATEFPLPAEYRRDLFAFADHMTFSTDLGAFFTDGQHNRTRVMDAITWCVGAVTLKSRIVVG